MPRGNPGPRKGDTFAENHAHAWATTWADHASVRCQWCNAKPGEPCKTPRETLTPRPHVSRTRDAYRTGAVPYPDGYFDEPD